jgi:bifunctional non-homologous end joining protein LigD
VLTRYPDGIDGKSFFQKDAPSFVPDWIRIERMWSEQTQREVRYFIVEDLESLLYIVNMGAIPLHIWSSRTTALEQPDWCILDLDPKGAPFRDVVKIAKKIRTLCQQIELPCFVKTSGSTGLHVLVPLGHRYTYEQSRSLGELLARVVVAKLSQIATVTRAVSEREGRVYIDYLQNGHGRLLASPFSVRPLPKAPVSMPLKWSEVTSKLDIRRYTMKNAAKRMRSLKEDPLRKVMGLSPNLTAALGRLTQKFL